MINFNTDHTTRENELNTTDVKAEQKVIRFLFILSPFQLKNV